MPTLQKWLNAWVNVNSKHVVYLPQEKRSSHSHLDGSEGKGQKTPTDSHATESTKSAANDDQELQAIRRFNSRKHRRRLQKTNSATDLIREKANRRGQPDPTPSHALDTSGSRKSNAEVKDVSLQNAQSVARLKASPTEIPVVGPQESTLPHSQQMHNSYYSYQRNDGDLTVATNKSENSLLWVAGFFGADVSSVDSSTIEQQLREHQNSDHAATSSAYLKKLEDGRKNIPFRDSCNFHKEALNESTNRSIHNDDASVASNASTPRYQFLPKPFQGRGTCTSCKALEIQLLKSQQDMEYLRGIAIRNEYVCARCNCSNDNDTEVTHPDDSDGNTYANASTLRRASQRLQEVNRNHQNQIEQLNRDRLQWQNKVDDKIIGLNSLCQKLEEDSTISNQKCVALQLELGETRSERDDMAGEVHKLRAQLNSFEKMSQEHDQLKRIVHRYEKDGLQRANKEIESRDKLISELAVRLESALDTLEMERQQQRQRRQIIFPVARSHPVGDNPGEPPSQQQVADDLKRTKEELRLNQEMLQFTRAEAEKREAALLLRCSQLEKQIAANNNNANGGSIS